MRSSDVDAVVADIDRRRQAEFWRNPDRPSTKFVPVRQRQDQRIVTAKARERTAAWRTECDRLRRPEARDIGMALVTALVTSPDLGGTMTDTELTFVAAALADLEARGFDRQQVKLVLRRLRNRLVDPDDRQGEESESTGPSPSPSAVNADRILTPQSSHARI